MKKNQYFAHPTSVIDQPVDIDKGVKIWHFTHIMSGAKIGQKSSLGQNVFVGGKSIIGNFVKIQNNVSIYDGVTLDDHVFCGPSMVFTNDQNPRSKYPKNGDYLETHVKEGATIGANVTIVCGNTIGRHCFIGAGSVVTSDIPDYALFFGNPAKLRGWICECGDKIIFRNNASHCNNCQRKYIKKKDKITLSSKE